MDGRWMIVNGGFGGEAWVGWMYRRTQKHLFVWFTAFTTVLP